MSAAAFAPRPPVGSDLWSRIMEFVTRNDPRTTRGAAVYAVFGLILGIALGR